MKKRLKRIEKKLDRLLEKEKKPNPPFRMMHIRTDKHLGPAPPMRKRHVRNAEESE